jgi:dUTP pyrophosphatase
MRSVVAPPDWPVPEYATAGAAGMDLRSLYTVTLSPQGLLLFNTGWHVEIPEGWEGQVRMRSGLAAKGITMVNGPGTIDSDYRGEIYMILFNLNEDDFDIIRGQRIAQLVIAPVARAEVSVVTELSPTARGSGGFGSTGDK